MDAFMNKIRGAWDYYLVLSILVVMLLSLWVLLLERECFCFDDMGYFISYTHKFSSEGRWINYLAFKCIRWMDEKVVLLFSFVCLFAFCYRVVSNFLPPKMSMLMALCATFSIPFYYAAEWPLTLFLTYIFAFVAAVLHDRMNIFVFFVLFGTLFCGVVSSFYFVLPLLFLKEDNKRLVLVILGWIFGMIFGFAVAEVATYVRYGHFIELAGWRNPSYVTGWETLCLNIQRMVQYLVEHVRLMGPVALIAIFISIIVHFWSYRKKLMRGIILFGVFLLVVLSSYAQALPVGIWVEPRTSWGLYLGSIILVVFFLKKIRYIQMFLALVTAGSFFVADAKEITAVNMAKCSARRSFERLGLDSAHARDVVLILGENTREGFEEWCNSVPRMNWMIWSEAAISMGFERIAHITDSMYLQKRGVDVSLLKFKRRAGYYYAISNNMLIVKLDPDYYKGNFEMETDEGTSKKSI